MHNGALCVFQAKDCKSISSPSYGRKWCLSLVLGFLGLGWFKSLSLLGILCLLYMIMVCACNEILNAWELGFSWDACHVFDVVVCPQNMCKNVVYDACWNGLLLVCQKLEPCKPRWWVSDLCLHGPVLLRACWFWDVRNRVHDWFKLPLRAVEVGCSV